MPATVSSQVLTSVRTVGGLLPADMMIRIAEGKDVSGSRPADYHVVGVRSVQAAAERHWDFLKGAWRALRDAIGDAGHDPSGLAVESWLLPLFEEHGFRRPERIPAGIQSTDRAATFPVTHRWRHVPIHLVSWDTDLDHRVPGGGLPPQSMLQECLNRSDEHLWGLLSNGRQLRLLRDSSSLAGAAFIEIDLEAMFDGELFDEFVLLYRLLHVSRFEIPDGAAPSACWLEKWRIEAIDAGARALDQLRDGVQDAIAHLGTGFFRHPANTRLRDNLDADLFKRALLRLAYRLLFWFVAEDRDVLLTPGTDENTRNRYEKYYSARRLRATALRRAGTTHGDLWRAMRLVLSGLADENGLPQLGLPGLGGIYDNTGTDQILHDLEISNEHLLAAIRSLARVHDTSTKRYRPVDYRNLGAEELGSIYESLLELVPKWSKGGRQFILDVMPGNERKTTGSYYTPSPLIDCLLDTALDPVLDEAQKRGEVEVTTVGTDPAAAIAEALLSITVCDPACGSGHFLVVAARRIAKRLAAVRECSPEPTVEALRAAMRDVVTHCTYGVDINPMAVELAKVSLWLEALEPGKPLSFLDAHIKCGNALIGATPALMAKGIPDDAFKPIQGDDKRWASLLRKANAKEREGQEGLFSADELAPETNTAFAAQLTQITYSPNGSLRDVHRQAAAYHDWEESTQNRHAHHVADAWCAAFVWQKTKDALPAITHGRFRAIQDPMSPPVSSAISTEIAKLRTNFGFFHWHLEFPEIFRVPEGGPDPSIDSATGWSGGFMCLLGNPPWERINLQEREFFAQRDEAIATASNADTRKKLIRLLCEDNPDLYAEFQKAKRRAEGENQFLRGSQRYPFTARGDINTYAVFAETNRMLIGSAGRVGVILPTGIATDAPTQFFFKDLVQQKSLASLYDFENARPIFHGVHRSFKFALLTIAGRVVQESRVDFSFFLHDVAELDDSSRRFTLTSEEITLLNPNSGTCPVFRTRRDAEITLGIYRGVPILLKQNDPYGNPWEVSVARMFHMADDSGIFHTRQELERDGWCLKGNIFTKGDGLMLPIYEAKMLHYYDHRWATYEPDGSVRDITITEKQRPSTVGMPRYWVTSQEVDAKLAEKRWRQGWIVGLRKICRATDERTVIGIIFPAGGLGDSGNIIYPSRNKRAHLLYACACSIVLDYTLRQKLGGTNLSVFQFEQLPFLRPEGFDNIESFISDRTLELVYTAYNMAAYGHDLGDDGPPFKWDEERRFLVRAELDALFFRLYGIERDDVEYIIETFPIAKRKDVAKYGSYRTKETILEFYDQMAAADAAGTPYETPITPPPGQGPRHLARSEP